MSEFLDVAEIVLRRERRPLSARNIVDIGLESGLFSDGLDGLTPWQTMKSKLSVHIRRAGSESRFVRTAPGRFHLRELAAPLSVYEAPPLVPPDTDERVMVVPVSELEKLGRFQGFSPEGNRYIELCDSPAVTSMPRLEAEDVVDRKQFLTYVVVTRGSSVLAYKRGSYNRVDSMLRGAHCIGFGGHVDSADRTIFSQDGVGLMDSAVRELGEELALPAPDRKRLDERRGLELVGVINDDSSVVGQRHLAFVVRYEVSDDPGWDTPTRGEKSITQLRWVDTDHRPVRLPHYEYWSQLCFRSMFPDAVRASADFTVRRKAPFAQPNLMVVVGELGSGKSAATEVLVSDYGYASLNSGRVLAGMLGVPPVPITDRQRFQELAWQFIAEPANPERFASVLLKEAVSLGPRVILDGIRQVSTLDALIAGGRTTEPPMRVTVVFVETAPDLAWELYQLREGSVGGPLAFYDLRRAPVEREARGLIRRADAVLHNWLGESFVAAVRALMDACGVEPLS